jgi:exonuclease III
MQSHQYILQLLTNCDVLCLSETWLRPHELHVVDELVEKHFTSNVHFNIFSKSSMCDVDVSYKGRPFGGMSIICKISDVFRYYLLDVPSDRIMGVCVTDVSGSPIQVIFNIYLPFFNSSSIQTELFVETIDILQSAIDKYAYLAPIQIMGDSNVQLPKRSKCHKSWHKGDGLNKHSAIMYDFLVANNFVVADFVFNQPVNFTYFCEKRNITTWIDHIFVSKDYINSVEKCEIILHDGMNNSDHLPLHILCNVPISKSSSHIKYDRSTFTPKKSIKWDKICKETYLEKLINSINTLPQLDDRPTIEGVDAYCDSLRDAFHTAAAAAGGDKGNYFRPKPYWCPELSQLRDRKRLWWKIWSDCGRPRDGHVFQSYKGVKKLYRKMCRQRANDKVKSYLLDINQLYKERKMTAFWNKIKVKKKKHSSSSLDSEAFAKHFSDIMSEKDTQLDEFQKHIKSFVEDKCSSLDDNFNFEGFTDSMLNSALRSLKTNVSPGLDGITAEHFLHGNCEPLRKCLLILYNTIVNCKIIPNTLAIGVIVPVLKKATLNPNVGGNYRPITIGSTHCKLLEMLMMPQDQAHDNQFGFRHGRGTSFACVLLNDIMAYCKNSLSPLYICSLDAEKCFDSIWHEGLFYKLYGKMKNAHWCFLYKWYKCMTAVVRWDGNYSHSFSITRGTKQGSILSPTLFNIFINDLLVGLHSCKTGVNIGGSILNSFAYADDVSLFSATSTGLQSLINICEEYSKQWRFTFGIKKTKCMVVGSELFKRQSRFYLGKQQIDIVEDLEILGTIFNHQLNSTPNIDKRKSSCRKSMYSLAESGCCYPGLSSEVKIHLWKSIGQPTLTAGLETLSLNHKNVQVLENMQGSFVKRMLGFPQRSHHTKLVQATNVKSITYLLQRNFLSLWHRIFKIQSPTRNMCAFELAKYMVGNLCSNGFYPLVLHRLNSYSLNPTTAVLSLISLMGSLIA